MTGAKDETSLAGQLLLAMPQMDDPNFARSVVFLFAHSEEAGAMGLVVNKTIETLTMDELYAHLEIEPVFHSRPSRLVHFGGPVAPDHGFMLHSADYREDGTLRFGKDFAMTATFDILRTIGKGNGGPQQWLLALGYAGWGPGQLEDEIRANGWLSVPADHDLVFGDDNESKWQRALAKLGVSPEMLSGGAGHA